MACFPFLTYFSHVLPLDYELSLTPYEIISKLLKWLDGLTNQVNGDTAAIQDLQKRVKDLEDKGFTNEQLREVLDDMVADGEFDFLIDLITAKTELWDTVGLAPFAQVYPEMVGIDPTGYSFQSMAMGHIGSILGPKVGAFAFNHKTGDTVDGSLVITINLETGLVVGYDTTNKGAMNSMGFNPVDSLFYVTPGGDSTEIVKYDYEASIQGTISSADSTMKAGGITFVDNNAIIAWYAKDGTDSKIIISEYEHIELRESVSPITGTIRETEWHRPYINAVGRQDIYADSQYLYMPTYWHENSDETYHWTTYNKQDVFTLSSLEYIRTQYIDSRNEVESGCFFLGHYIGINLSNAALICKASVHADNEYNSAYINVSQLGNTEFNYGPYTLYGDGSTSGFFCDGTIEHPFKRLTHMQLVSLPYARYTGVKYYITGDFTSSGAITNLSFRNGRQRMILQGHDGCILPKLTFDNCSRVVIQDMTIRGYDSNYILYFFDTDMAQLTNVKFVNGDTDNTIASVLLIENSLVNATEGDGAHIGFDGTTPTNYVKTTFGGRVSGKFYRDYDTTGSGTYITMGEFSFTKAANLTGNVLALMTDNGLHVTGQLTAGADFAANATLLSLPSDNKQFLSSLVKERGSGVYLTAAADDAALALYYDYDDDVITTLGAIDNGTTIYINDVIPLESVNV